MTKLDRLGRSLEHDTRLLRYLGPSLQFRHRGAAAARGLPARRRRAHSSPSALLVGHDGAALLGRRTAHRVGAAADLAGLRRPEAALAREKCYTPETFATPFTGATTIHSITNQTPIRP